MKLTLAGPGSGKTTDLVKQIKNTVSNLKQNREMAVITYTNASVDDIKEKLSDSIVITPNIFIGTIHSFLMHYFIMPHADSLGYNVANVLVVDKLSMKGFEWIDSWVEQSNPKKDKKERQDIKSRLMQSRRNSAIEAADVVLMTDEPSKIVSAMKLSRRTMRIVKENIIFAIFIKVLVLILSAFGLSTMWEAVFADVGVSIIAIINALRVL